GETGRRRGAKSAQRAAGEHRTRRNATENLRASQRAPVRLSGYCLEWSSARYNSAGSGSVAASDVISYVSDKQLFDVTSNGARRCCDFMPGNFAYANNIAVG